MTFDTNVPLELKKTQEWFASIITRPIDVDNNMISVSPTGNQMSEEAKQYIIPSKGLKPHERIQIYNQQYWWRLLTIMQENFPLVTRLFGYHDFNQTIAFPYLNKHKPSTWSLNVLGDTLENWVAEEYEANDKKLILEAVKIDYAYLFSFFAKKKEPLNFELLNSEELSFKNLTLQPHVHLFQLDSDLIEFRSNLYKESPDYWVENDFPKLKKGEFHFILYRNHHNFVLADTISPIAYNILSMFKQGASIDSICEWLETQDEETFEEASSNMQNWFGNWAALHLLTTK
jgi:hypothetical protein